MLDLLSSQQFGCIELSETYKNMQKSLYVGGL